MRDGDGSALGETWLAVGAGNGNRSWMKPAAFDQTNDLMPVARNDGGATLSALDFVAEEKEFGVGLTFVERSGEILEHIGGHTVFARDVESVWVLEARRTESFGDDGIADRGSLGREG